MYTIRYHLHQCFVRKHTVYRHTKEKDLTMTSNFRMVITSGREAVEGLALGGRDGVTEQNGLLVTVRFYFFKNTQSVY